MDLSIWLAFVAASTALPMIPGSVASITAMGILTASLRRAAA